MKQREDKKVLTIYLTADLFQRFKIKCVRDGNTMTETVVDLIEASLTPRKELVK